MFLVCADEFNLPILVELKKWWKDWIKYPPLGSSAQKQIDYLEDGRSKLHKMAEDLMFVRGLWVTEDYSKLDKKVKSPLYYFGRIKELIKEADLYLSEAQNRIDWTYTVHTPGTVNYKLNNGQRKEELDVYWIQKFPNWTPEQIIQYWQDEELKDGVKEADRVVSRKLFRHLKALLESAGGSTKFRAYDRVFKVDRITFIMQDIKNLYGLNEDYDRSPLYDRLFAEIGKTVKRILDGKGLGFLWYGNIYVFSEAESHKIKYEGFSNKNAAASYNINTDSITFYMTPDPSTNDAVQVLLHELGHRYWYKFMDRADRLKFENWFEEGLSITNYGNTHVREGFAELFMHYMINSNLPFKEKDYIKSLLKQAAFNGKFIKKESKMDYWYSLLENFNPDYSYLMQPLKYIDVPATTEVIINNNDKLKEAWVNDVLYNFPSTDFTYIADVTRNWAQAALDEYLQTHGIDTDNIYALWYKNIPDEVTYSTIYGLFGSDLDPHELVSYIQQMFVDEDIEDNLDDVLEKVILADNEEAQQDIQNAYELYVDSLNTTYKNADEYVKNLIEESSEYWDEEKWKQNLRKGPTAIQRPDGTFLLLNGYQRPEIVSEEELDKLAVKENFTYLIYYPEDNEAYDPYDDISFSVYWDYRTSDNNMTFEWDKDEEGE